MLEILLNAAVRLLLLGVALWLTLRLLRVRNPHAEVLAWRWLLLMGLALPILLASGLTPRALVDLPLAMIASGSLTSAAWAPEFAAAAGVSAAGALLALYLLVAGWLLVRLAAGLLGLWRIAARARSATEEGDVRISARLRSPATFGSIILLPPESVRWSDEQRQVVLVHERAHVRGHDGYWLWLAQIHAAVFWFNPFAWWLRRRLEILAETTSDDAVVAARHDPVSYAALLLAFARQPNSRSVAMSVAESNVPGRIERLLARTCPGTEISRHTRWLAYAALIPVMLVAGSTSRAIAQPTAPSPIPTAASNGAGSVRISRAPDPDQYYPEAAKQAQVTASVVVEVSVDARGNLVDARVLELLPANDPYGFGAAAIAVARGAEYSNPLGRTSSIRFMVKFALTSDPPAAAGGT